MRVTLKLFASLAAHLPPDARASHRVALDIDTGGTVLDVIRRQRIPDALCAIVLVDGQWVGRPERATRELHDGEVLAIWPPVAGGAPVFTRSLEMGVARDEFFRLLLAVIPHFETSDEPPTVASGLSRTTMRWTDGDRRGTIRLAALPDPLALGLPRHRVDIVLAGWSEEEGEAFLVRFHRAFLRGGG
jgi:sulfur carrier protein ThiS